MSAMKVSERVSEGCNSFRPTNKVRGYKEHSLDLAIIGNCTYSAMIDMRGRIVFCCLPRFDRDPMFCHLLLNGQDDYGFFDIVVDDFSHSEQHYMRNTAIVVTRLYTSKGACLEIVDFAPRFKNFGRSFHPSQIVRRVRPLKGHPRIQVRCRPAHNYGESKCETTRGVNHVCYYGSDYTARLTTDAPVSFITEEVPFVVIEEFCLILGPNESIPRSTKDVCHEFLEKTRDYWDEFVHILKIPFEWQKDVIRAAITLKLCSFEESGAILAALTTSIPEAPNSGRTWEYRYCWLRDSYHTVRALNNLGATKTMQRYLQFILNIVRGAGDNGDLQPLYGLLMQTELPEKLVETLPGYRGMGPVRVGNDAYHQVQNDNYGSVILAVTQIFFDERITISESIDIFEQLERLGELAVKAHDQPDAGLWELRGSMRVHTFSSVMCWAACDRLAKIAEKIERKDRFKYWHDHSANIKNYIDARIWDEELQSFISVLSGETRDVDACLLLLADLGFVKVSDPKYIKTVEKVGEILKFGNFLYRYVEEDDFGRPENAFTICTFWYISALASIGKKDEARELFTNLLNCRNHVGLLSEDLDVETGELWGNYPQTYSLVGLINAAIKLSQPWEEMGIS